MMVSVKKFVYNIPYPEITSLLLLTALAYTAFYLNNYSKLKSPRETKQSCNLFEGKWVYDEKRQPLYKAKECSFLMEEFACEKHGRRNLTYLNWRWQPNNCDLPRFNGKVFLEKIRGKKLYFVGDSINRNQWSSLLCLIESSLSPSSRKEIALGEHSIYLEIKGFSARLFLKDYNATIGAFWSPFLVESNNDDAHKDQRIIRINTIGKNAMQWNDADILIFNSYLWWMSEKNSLVWGSYESPDAIYKQTYARRSYEMGLNTWSDWLEFNINRTKTKMFFMGLSPNHERGEGNLSDTGKKYCYNETQPIQKEGYLGIDTDIGMMRVLESTLWKLANRGVKVQYLNITQLSESRKDAHTSVHKMFFFKVTKEMFARNASKLADCLHWCLPGLPDTWNQILYSYIMNS